jgi:hypothetical protein
MPVIIPCIKCQRKLRVQERLVGKLVKCPGCQTKFIAQPAAAPAAAVTPTAAVASPPAAARPAAPASPPPSRPSLAPAAVPPRAVPPAPAPRASPRAHAIEAGPPLEEITIEHLGDGITPPPASRPQRPPAAEDDFEEPRPARGKPATAPVPSSSFLGVFVTLGGILLLTIIVGLVCAWWVNSSVQSLRSGVVPQPPPQKKAGPARK